ncbi:MAG: DUF374 domain-containing protein [Thermoanaerobaculia bacterium]
MVLNEEERVRRPWWLRSLGSIYAAAYVGCSRFEWMTWRRGDDAALRKIDELLARGVRLLAVFWHGSYLPLFVLLRNRRACIVSSESFRGEVIGKISRLCGFENVRVEDGSGDDAIIRIAAALSSHQAGALAVDGPLGPRHLVKRGVPLIASRAGMALLPVAVAMSKKKVLDQRWDRMELPRLFSRIELTAGELIFVPPELDETSALRYAAEVERALEALDRSAAAKVAAATSTRDRSNSDLEREERAVVDRP